MKQEMQYKKEHRLSLVINNRNFIAFVFFIILMLYAQLLDITDFRHDSLQYWTRGEQLITSHGIDLSLYPNTVRGYFIYLFILFFKYVGNFFGNPYMGWHLLTSALTTVIFLYIIPYIMINKFESKRVIENKAFIRYMILLAILLFFWGDFLLHPMSDLLSCYFFLILVALSKYVINVKKLYIKLPCYIFIGALAYATYNVRVAYLYSILILILLGVIKELKKTKKLGILFILAICIGGFIVAIPQMKINEQYIGKQSPFINTEQLYGKGNDLRNAQLLWGLEYQRYETYDGSLDLYNENGVHFLDETGREIIKREGFEKFSSITPVELLKLAFQYPGDIIGIYVRHFANIMIPLWNQLYIMDLYTDKFVLILGAMLIWMIFAIDKIFNFDSEKCKCFCFENISILLAIIPSILQAAGAIEIRFFYMCYIFLYYNVCCKIRYRELWQKLKGKRLLVFVLCMIIGALWITILGDTLADNKYRVMLINDCYTP